MRFWLDKPKGRVGGWVSVAAKHSADAVNVDDCNFSAKPVWENAVWPPDTPRGAKLTCVADYYEQKPRYENLGSPVRATRVETDSGPNGSARCRIIDETTVRQRVVRVYCVKKFAVLRKKLSKKAVGLGVLGLGVAATIACPILIPLHVAIVVAGSVGAGAAASTATGGAILALPPSDARRDPGTEEKLTYESRNTEERNRVLSSEKGSWRSCRDSDSTHLGCV
jgi:hypothetical protein